MDAREQAREQVTVLGPDARFKGDLVVDGILKVLGTFEGNVRAGEVHIGPSAHSNASIEASTIIIDGKHQGDLVAKDCLQLTSKANVQGDVTAAALAVAEGATFVGRCIVGPEALANRAAPSIETKVEPKPQGRKSRANDWMENAPAAPATGDWLANTGAAPQKAWSGQAPAGNAA
jgi:cytoskeletal protein CcmA (bactofilin family)